MPPTRAYVIAVVAIVAIGAAAIVFAEDQTASIVTFCGGAIAMLTALWRGQVEQHRATNSRLDQLLKTFGAQQRAEGIEEGKKHRDKT